MSEEPKKKWARAEALEVARELLAVLQPNCERVLVAGSLRRMKAEAGDVEILFIPRIVNAPDVQQLFGGVVKVNAAEASLEELVGRGVIAPRLNKLGRRSWGAANKLAVHVASGVPVDLFTATAENWWHYVVCRTGGAGSNVAICEAAIERGWKWNPYGEGFSRPKALGREIRPMHSEREVFEFVGLEYREPKERK